MFVLRTGLQGNGKTLNTIKEVDIKAASEGRVVYYHNIRGFNPRAEVLQAEWVEFDNPLEWHLLPNNSIIVIDEAQTFFRGRKQGAQVPEYASALETMRHRGHELHCITQAPALIDIHFRKLCNSHIHYVRGHKGKVIKRWEFQQVNSEVERKDTFTNGESSRIVLDKRYFGVYESVAQGSSHHFKFKPPKALWVFIGACLFIVFGAVYFYNKRIAPSAEPVALTPDVQRSAPVQTGAPVVQSDPLEAYVSARTPRLADVPSSAPIYDELTKPVAYPKLSCLMSSDPSYIERNSRFRVINAGSKSYICECFTQQGTWHKTTFSFCQNVVANGYFDPAIPDRQPAEAGGAGEARADTPASAGGIAFSGNLNTQGAIR